MMEARKGPGQPQHHTNRHLSHSEPALGNLSLRDQVLIKSLYAFILFLEVHINVYVCVLPPINSLGKYSQRTIAPLFGDKLNMHLLESKYRKSLLFLTPI